MVLYEMMLDSYPGTMIRYEVFPEQLTVRDCPGTQRFYVGFECGR